MLTSWYRRVAAAADRHPWCFAGGSALVLSGFAGGLAAFSHQPAREVVLQLLLWGPGWFALSGLTSKLRQARH
jgi:hypothetical protein